MITTSHLTIPIPDILASRPRTAQGFPILFTTAYINGKPDLRVSNPDKREECFQRKLCGVCGERLNYWLYFVTGKLGVKNRTFSDPPMHSECLNYAMEVCPFLLGTRVEHTAQNVPGAIVDRSAVLNRPKEIGMYQTRGYKRVWVDSRNWLFLADAPFDIIWRQES